jgi:large conductance mechanosensitive channel
VKTLKSFKEFINRGNIVDLAIAVIFGIAFGLVVAAFIADIIMPILAIPFGKPNFDQAMIITVNDAQIKVGAFIGAFVNFLVIAAALFLVITLYNRLTNRDGAPPPNEVDLLTEIRDELRRKNG